jgi:hypothetical protein
VISQGAPPRAAKRRSSTVLALHRPGHAPVLSTCAGLVSVTGSAWRFVAPRRRTLS